MSTDKVQDDSGNISDLQTKLLKQQVKITELKELVKKGELNNENSTTLAQEKVKNIAQKLTHLKAMAYSRKNLEKSQSELELNIIHEDPQLKNQTPNYSTINLSTSNNVHKKTSDSLGKEKIQLLKQQVEQSKQKLAKRESNKREIEEIVTQLKEKLDSTHQSLLHSSDQGRSMSNLSNAMPILQDKYKSAVDLRHYNTTSENARIHFLENRVQTLEKELEIINKNTSNDKSTVELENKILDLEENLKEKESIINARTQAVSLMTQMFSAKGKDTVNLLETTQKEMLNMQKNFIDKEDELKNSIKQLKSDLTEKNNRIKNLEEVNDILETARFDLTVKNSELQSEINEINTNLNISKLNELEDLNKILKAENLQLKDTLESLNYNYREEEELKLETKQNLNKHDITKYKETIASLEEQLEEKTTEYNVLNATFLVLEEKLKGIEPKQLFPCDELSKVKQELEEASNRCSEYENIIVDLQKELQYLKSLDDHNEPAAEDIKQNKKSKNNYLDLNEHGGTSKVSSLNEITKTNNICEQFEEFLLQGEQILAKLEKLDDTNLYDEIELLEKVKEEILNSKEYKEFQMYLNEKGHEVLKILELYSENEEIISKQIQKFSLERENYEKRINDLIEEKLVLEEKYIETNNQKNSLSNRISHINESTKKIETEIKMILHEECTPCYKIAYETIPEYRKNLFQVNSIIKEYHKSCDSKIKLNLSLELAKETHKIFQQIHDLLNCHEEMHTMQQLQSKIKHKLTELSNLGLEADEYSEQFEIKDCQESKSLNFKNIEIEMLKEQNEKCEIFIKSLSTNNKVLETAILAREKEIDVLQTLVKEQKQQLIECFTEHENAASLQNNKLIFLENKLRELNELISLNSEDLSNKQDTIETLNTQIMDLYTSIEELNVKLTERDAEIEALKKSLAISKNNVIDLNQQISYLNDNLSLLSQNKNCVNEKVEQEKLLLEVKNKELIEKLKKFAANLKRKNEECNKLNKKIEQNNLSHETNKELEQSLIECKTSIKDLKLQKEELNAINLQLKSELESYTDLYKEKCLEDEYKEKELSDLCCKVEDIKILYRSRETDFFKNAKENKNFKIKLQSLLVEKKDISEKIKLLESELVKKNLRIEECEAEIQMKSCEIQNLSKEIESLRQLSLKENNNKKLFDIVKQLNKLKEQNSHLLNTFESEKNIFQETISHLDAVHKEIQKKTQNDFLYIEQLKKENKNLLDLSEKAEEYIIEISEIMLQSTETVLQSKVGILEKLNALKENQLIITEEYTKYKRENKNLNEQIISLQRELVDSNAEKDLLKSIENKINILENEKTALKDLYENQLRIINNELNKLEEENNLQLTKLNAENIELSKEIDKYRDEINNLVDENYQLKENMKSKSKEKNDIENELIWFQMQNQSATQLQLEIELLKTQTMQDKENLEKYKNQLANLTQAYEKDTQELKAQIAFLDSIRMQIGQNQTDDQVFTENENKRLKELIDDKEAIIESLKLTMSTQENETRELLSTKDLKSNLENINSNEMLREEELNNSKDSVETQSDEKKINLDKVSGETLVQNDILSQQNICVEKSVEDIKHIKTIENLQQNIDELQSYASELESKYKFLESAYENTLQLFENKSKEYEKLFNIHKKLEQSRNKKDISEDNMSATLSDYFQTNPDSTIFDNISNNEPQPIHEEPIIPKEAYLCYTNVNPQDIIIVDEDDDNWKLNEALLEEQHQMTRSQQVDMSLTAKESYETKLEEYKKQIQELEKENNGKQDRINELNLKLIKLSKKIKEYKNHTCDAKWQAQHDNLDEAIIEELKQQINQREKELTNAAKMCEQLIAEKENLSKRISSLVATNESLNETQANLQYNNNLYLHELQNLQQKLKDRSVENNTSEGLGSETSKENFKDEESLEDTSKTGEQDNLRTLFDESIKSREEIENENIILNDKINELIMKNKVIIENYEMENNRLKEELTEKKNLLDNLNLKNENLQTQITEYLTTIEQISKESNTVKEKLNNIIYEYDEQLKENRSLEEQLQNCIKKTDTLSEKIENMKKHAQQESLRTAELEKQLSELHLEILRKNEELEKLGEQIHLTTLTSEDKLFKYPEIILENQMQVCESSTLEKTQLLENTIQQITEEKQQLETELKVLNEHVLTHLEIEDKMKETILKLDEKEIEIAELKKSIEIFKAQLNTKTNISLEEHEAVVNRINVEWTNKFEKISQNYEKLMKTKNFEDLSDANEIRNELIVSEESKTFEHNSLVGTNLFNVEGPSVESIIKRKTISPQKENGSIKEELDLALYMFHQRDMKCEELKLELLRLLAERDILQLKLAESIRETENFKDISYQKSGLSTVKISKDIQNNIEDNRNSESDKTIGNLNENVENKISQVLSNHETQRVGIQTQYQQEIHKEEIRQDIANIPSEAISELIGEDLSDSDQNPSTKLLNWLWGKH